MSFDQIGPLSQDIYGSALALSVIAGGSGNDPTTTKDKVRDYTKEKAIENSTYTGEHTFQKVVRLPD